MTWLIYGISAGLFFAIYNTLLKLSSNYSHGLIGSLFLSVGSAIITIGLIFIFKFTSQEVIASSKGIKLALGAGVISAVGSYLYFLMYQHRAPISLGLSAVSISTIVFSAIIGIFFFGEKVTFIKIMALLFAGLSVYLFSL